MVVRPVGLEPTIFGLEDRCLIQLDDGRIYFFPYLVFYPTELRDLKICMFSVFRKHPTNFVTVVGHS